MMIKRLFITGFLTLGILFFCLGQDQSEAFNQEMDSFGTTNEEKEEARYLLKLNQLAKKYKDHLERNCHDQAELYRNYGRHFHVKEDFKIALVYTRDSALNTAMQCQPLDNVLISQIYQNLYLTSRQLNDIEQRDKSMDSLIYYIDHKDINDVEHIANMINSVAFHLNSDLNQVDDAKIYSRKSIANYERIGLVNKKYLRPLAQLIGYEIESKNYELAIKIADKTLNLAKEIQVTTDKKFSSTLFYKKAVAYQAMSQLDSAFQMIKIGKEYATQNKDEIEFYYLTGSEAELAYLAGQYREAIDLANKAINFLEPIIPLNLFYLIQDYKKSKLQSQIKLGLHDEAQKTAIEIMKKAAPNFKPNIQSFHIDGVLIHDYNYFDEATKLYLQASKEDLKPLEYFAIADQLDEYYLEHHNATSDNETQSDISKAYHGFCEGVLSYIFTNNLEDQFPDKTAYYIASSKSMKLYKKINEEAKLPPEILLEYKEIMVKNADINSRYSEAIEAQDKTINKISEEYYEFLKSKDEFEERLAKLNLNTNFTKYKNNFVGFAQNNLDDTRVILDLFAGENMIFGYSLNSTSINFYADSTIGVLKSDEFLDIYSSPNQKGAEAVEQEISQFFLPFFLNDLENKTNLTIIPDGKLLYFPFEALKIKDQNLIESIAINYAFSFNLTHFERKELVANNSYTGFGMSYSKELLEEIKNSQQLSKLFKKSFQLSPLPNAVREIEESQKIFDGTSFLDDACTIEKFREHCADSKIIHIANHSLLNNKNSKLSSIVFGHQDKIDLLNVIDIQPLDLKAELAILSSCNSGRGQIFDGDGIRSLGQSFAEAGCHAVVVNLWDANDKSSRFIISAFNQHLKEGMTKSEALRQAKLQYLQQATPTLSHPKYWANVVLIGSDDPIAFTNKSPKWLIFAAIGLLVGLTLAYFLFKKK